MSSSNFPLSLRIALKALGLSRTQAASLLQVDKSLVSRWAAGSVHPTEHNLAKITQLIAQRVTGFTMHDWKREPGAFAELLGLDPELAGVNDTQPLVSALSMSCIAEALQQTERRGAVYEGFWRTTRPSLLMSDRLFHDFGMIRRSKSGLLEVSMGGAGLGFHGWALPLEGNLFAMLDGAVGFTPLFLVFRGVTLPKATVLDGLLLMAALDQSRTPTALPIIMERIADLSGDPEKDDATCRDLSSNDPFANEAEVSDEIRRHLVRDVGPSAEELGGDLFLAVTASRSLSRGTTPPGQLKG